MSWRSARKRDRRRRLRAATLAVALLGLGCEPAPPAEPTRPNLLLIVADDLHWQSVGAFGSPVADTTPHIDRLAAEGMRLERAHVTVSVCMPSRAVWMTGRYPHRSGALGFEPIASDVPTVVEALHDAGYYTGIFDKLDHVVPSRRAAWDEAVPSEALGSGRDPTRFQQQTERFLASARAARRPFFLMANLRDAHRPFPGGGREAERHPPAPRRFLPEEVAVPGFLPDLPAIRSDLARYLAAVSRADAVAGAVLRALDEAGHRGDTLVMFLSDNAISLPFAKAGCWYHSTRTPWIVRWPGVVEPGSRDASHFVAGIDMAPTLLDAAGVAPLPGSDGESFVPVLRGEERPDRRRVFTQIDELRRGGTYPTRAVTEERFGYLFNAWSDGRTTFQNAAQAGPTMRALLAAARADPALQRRLHHLRFRAPEELYDYEDDPDALHNLIDDPRYEPERARLRNELLAHMERTGDPQLASFRRHLGLAP